jgi:hypothetical protein
MTISLLIQLNHDSAASRHSDQVGDYKISILGSLDNWRLDMFTVTKRSNNRVDIEFEGTLDADGMRTAMDELIEKSKDVEHGCMFYRIGEFQIPTLGALAVEFSRLPKLFGLLTKYDKCAVLSDTNWIRTATEIEGALIPGMEIKAFRHDEEDRAEAWLAG